MKLNGLYEGESASDRSSPACGTLSYQKAAPVLRLHLAAALLLCSGAAAAISGGEDAPETVITYATVQVNGASGTLVASNLVVTNGHVAAVPLPDMSPRFSRTNGHDPALWHPIPSPGVQVFIGAATMRADLTRRDIFSAPRTQLVMHDVNGGELLSGDQIGLKLRNHFLFVDGGRIGGELRLDGLYNRFGPWQTLRISKRSGSAGSRIRNGDRITLQALDGSYLGAAAGDRFLRADAWTPAVRHEFVAYTLEGRGPLSADPINHGGRVVITTPDVPMRAIQAPYAITANRIATPGFDDIALLELAEAVPSGVARPVPLKLRLEPGEGLNLDAYYLRTPMDFAGYGLMSGRTAPVWRQQAQASGARRETPNPFNDPELASRYSGISSASTQPGDSGGSWFADTPTGRMLVGITQQTGNNFLSPMFRGGYDTLNDSKPDVHAWFSMFLGDHDCTAVTNETGLRRQRGTDIGASTVCRFGAQASPFAVAYPDATRPLPGEDCLAIDPARLFLQRPTAPEGAGINAWVLSQGASRHLQVPGTWQQSYTRGAHLIRYLQSAGLNRICYSNRPNPNLVYFRP
ncbi:MAG: hypothetical protein ACK5PG_17160 [Lysobacterales bacterium]